MLRNQLFWLASIFPTLQNRLVCSRGLRKVDLFLVRCLFQTFLKAVSLIRCGLLASGLDNVQVLNIPVQNLVNIRAGRFLEPKVLH